MYIILGIYTGMYEYIIYKSIYYMYVYMFRVEPSYPNRTNASANIKGGGRDEGRGGGRRGGRLEG